MAPPAPPPFGELIQRLPLSASEDVEAFAGDVGGRVEFTRLAVTPGQVTDLALPSAPPKETDKRAFHGDTCQAEAIPPDVLAEIVREAIVSRFDMEAFRETLEREEGQRAEVMERLR